MKMKGGFIGILMIVFALTFIGSGEVGATNCYNFYYSAATNETCSNDVDFLKWDYMKLALHRDKTWEAATPDNPESLAAAGYWWVFGNAVALKTEYYDDLNDSLPFFFGGLPFISGAKTGQAKLLPDPYKSKANIAKAQGFIQDVVGKDSDYYCWFLKKVKVKECPWISE